MKVKEPSAKAGLHLRIKKTRSMATEDVHNFSTDSEEVQIVRDFAHLLLAVNSNGDAAEKPREGWGWEGRARAAMEESGKVAKIQDVSSERRLRSPTPHIPTYHVQMRKADNDAGW